MYIITAKSDYEETSTSDIANPLSVTEIATELVITRLKLIELLNTGQVNESDTIVTWPERFCLYTNLFKEVISYSDYKQKGAGGAEVLDLVSDIYNLARGGIIYSHDEQARKKGINTGQRFLYPRFEEDKKELLNIKIVNVIYVQKK